ncbi:MAG: hypothetical protein IPK07_09605 [Deltaproteobacteria bacterium]|nr:hypothetical protein [Deltaproteobacteria bacterium]
MRRLAVAELPELEVLRHQRTEDWYPKVHRIFRTVDDLLVKLVDLAPEHVDYYVERLLIAGEAPRTDPIEALVHDERGHFRGWAERYLPGLEPFRYFENEREVFAAHCERQCHLARRGYFDLDAATINYARRADGNVFTFDKDAVFRLDNLAPLRGGVRGARRVAGLEPGRRQLLRAAASELPQRARGRAARHQRRARERRSRTNRGDLRHGPHTDVTP